MNVYIATVFKTYSTYPVTYYARTIDNLTSYVKHLYPKLDLNDTDDVVFGVQFLKILDNINFID